MGRGRQKAKQTKVARDLKYYSPPTDLTALQRELASREAAAGDSSASDDETYLDEDDWSDEPSSSSSARRR